MTAEQTLNAYLDAFNRADVGAIAALYADTTEYRNPFTPAPLTNPQEVAAFETPMFAAFSDVVAKIDEALSDGNHVAARVTIQATHTGELQTPGGSIPATNRRIELVSAEFVRTDDNGRIVEHHRIMDSGSFLAQLTA